MIDKGTGVRGRERNRPSKAEVKERTDAARAAGKAPPPPEGRIAHILDLMATGRWVTGKTVRELAAEWGISLHELGRNATAASRMLRMSPEDTAAKRDTLLVNLESLQATAVEQGNVTAAIKAVQAQADILGLHVQKHSVAVVGEVSEADAARLVREQFGTHGTVRASTPADPEPEPTP